MVSLLRGSNHRMVGVQNFERACYETCPYPYFSMAETEGNLGVTSWLGFPLPPCFWVGAVTALKWVGTTGSCHEFIKLMSFCSVRKLLVIKSANWLPDKRGFQPGAFY